MYVFGNNGLVCCMYIIVWILILEAHVLLKADKKWLEKFLEFHFNEASFENLSLQGVLVLLLERDPNHVDYFPRLEILAEFFQHHVSLNSNLQREVILMRPLHYERVDVVIRYKDEAAPHCYVNLY